jgi:hypothetical protein
VRVAAISSKRAMKWPSFRQSVLVESFDLGTLPYLLSAARSAGEILVAHLKYKYTVDRLLVFHTYRTYLYLT